MARSAISDAGWPVSSAIRRTRRMTFLSRILMAPLTCRSCSDCQSLYRWVGSPGTPCPPRALRHLRLLAGHRFKQVGNRTVPRHHRPGPDPGERGEKEWEMGDTGVRHSQRGCVNNGVAVEEQVEVEGAGSPPFPSLPAGD